MTRSTFELGINYWPRRSAMYMWRELDLAEVRDDLQQIADMRFDTVRVLTLLEDFMPRRGVVDATMIGRLAAVAGAAKDAGLSVVPTLIVVNMSGRMWWPDWMLDQSGSAADIYEEPVIVDALIKLVGGCAAALSGDQSVRAFDIANEIDDAIRPKSRAAGRVWIGAMAAAIRQNAPGIPVRIGAHLPSLTTTNNMRVDDIGAELDEDVMHAYPLYSDAARSFLDPELVPFACALTAALGNTARPTLMQEFGLCTAPQGAPGHSFTDDFLGTPRSQYLASEAEAATYYDAVLRRLVDTGAAGAYAWCYGDYDARLFIRPPLDTAVRERTFGLVRADGSEKPAADVFRRFQRTRDARVAPSGHKPLALDVSADEYYRAPGAHFNRLYQGWVGERT